MKDHITREHFEQIIKIMSCWKIDRRKGNYRLPNNETLLSYLTNFIEEFCKNNHLAIANDGNIYTCLVHEKYYSDTIDIIKPFREWEKTTYLEQVEKIEKLAKGMIY